MATSNMTKDNTGGSVATSRTEGGSSTQTKDKTAEAKPQKTTDNTGDTTTHKWCTCGEEKFGDWVNSQEEIWSYGPQGGNGVETFFLD